MDYPAGTRWPDRGTDDPENSIPPNLEKKRLEDEIVLVGSLRAIILKVVQPLHNSGVDERQELYLERR